MARKKGSRSSYGEISINHKGRVLHTSVGSLRYESRFGGNIAAQDPSLSVGRIPEGWNHRPDLIADLFYGSASLWWLVCETNAIFDPFEHLKGGSTIRLPK